MEASDVEDSSEYSPAEDSDREEKQEKGDKIVCLTPAKSSVECVSMDDSDREDDDSMEYLGFD